jgi:DHA1 family tetracycline resistance protein-like MFS transporter
VTDRGTIVSTAAPPARSPVRSPARLPAVPLLLAVQLLSGIVLAPALAFFPVYLKELGLSAVLISGIVTLQRTMGLGSALVGGTLVDAIGAKRTLVAGQLLFFAATLLFLARDPWLIALIWVVSGIGQSPASLGATGYLVEKADHARLGLLTALMYWGTTLGGAIGNPAAGVLLGRTGWSGLVPFTALPAVGIALFTAVALPRSARRSPLLSGPSPSGPGRILAAVRLAGASPQVRLLGWMRFLPTVCYGMLLVFVPLLLKDAGASNTTIALYATAYSVCASLAQLAVGRIADRTGWKAPTAVSYAALAASSFAIAAFAGRLWVVFAAATAAISAAWALSTLVPIQMTRAVDVSEHGRALGYAHLFWNLAMIVSGLTGGVLFEAWNGLPLLVGGLAAAAGLPVAAGFARITGPQPAQPQATSTGLGRP